VNAYDYSHVQKLPYSIPKGEYLSCVLSAIVIVKRRSDRRDSRYRIRSHLLMNEYNAKGV
jgi:hypothetical protein